MDPQNFDAKLQQHMAELKPLNSSSNRKQNIFVHKDLKSCSHVFIRIDRVKKALEPPYEGPYVVQKNRLKPAYLLAVDNQNEQTSVGKKMRLQIGKNFPHYLMNNLLPAVAER
ncbi:retrovirus-related Pol polyprotein from transposon opus [Trichonephila clavipes]|nr:retrovirus-related Pol polyprotein from transposon opus [Trichonephila clavipes]